LLRRRRAHATRRKSGSRRLLVLLLISLVALLAAFGAALAYLRPAAEGVELTLDRLDALAEDGRLVEARFLDADATVTGTFREDGGEEPQRYFLSYPSSDAVTALLVETATGGGAKVSVDPQPAKDVIGAVSTFLLPLMILANLFALLFSASRGGSSAIGEVTTFGTIGNKRRSRRSTAPVTFDQVAGAEEAVAELREVVDYLKDPSRYEDVGALPPKGVLLFGPPGCGKTLLAKAVAGEAGVPFFSVAGAEFVESLVGVGAARVRDLFQRVRAVSPAIVFIDELDAAGRRRAAGGGGGGADEREQTLNQLLVEMDGFELSAGIVVIGATNRPDILDPALLRPGRFDRHVTVEQPDVAGRLEILELHAAGKPVSPAADLGVIARRTPGFSGADLANVLNEAALLTVREDKPEIEMPELEEAVQRVLAGPKKKGRVMSPEERKRAAFHESGHAIVAAASGRLEQVHRVSILARGRSLGSTTLHQGTPRCRRVPSWCRGSSSPSAGSLPRSCCSASRRPARRTTSSSPRSRRSTSWAASGWGRGAGGSSPGWRTSSSTAPRRSPTSPR
jgi:cell division protease FtsH